MLNNQHDLIILTGKGAWWLLMSKQSRRVLLLLMTTNAQLSADSDCFGEIQPSAIRLQMFNYHLINQAEHQLLATISELPIQWPASVCYKNSSLIQLQPLNLFMIILDYARLNTHQSGFWFLYIDISARTSPGEYGMHCKGDKDAMVSISVGSFPVYWSS